MINRDVEFTNGNVSYLVQFTTDSTISLKEKKYDQDNLGFFRPDLPGILKLYKILHKM